MLHFTITEEQFKYLALQKGNLSDHLYDRHFWQVAYDRDIENIRLNIQPFIPKDINSVLDVGSGLGGINAAINHALPEQDLKVTLLDGFADEALVQKHNVPFNDFMVATEFLRENGVKTVQGIDIEGAKLYNPKVDEPWEEFDLVVSFQAWCFHFPPEEYLEFVKAHITRGRTVIILDVRNEKPDWVLKLVEAFGPFEVLMKRPKWTRMVFRPQ